MRPLAARVDRSMMIERASSQREGLRDEIVLAADAADDLAAFERVRDHRAQQRRHHGVVDEARLHARAALGVLVAVELVDERDRRHVQLGADLLSGMSRSAR